MSVKVYIYLLVSILVFFGFDSLNINGIFKKNKIWQARVFFFLLALSMIQLVSTFIFDIYEAVRIV